MWLADHLRGKDVLLLAGSNAEAAALSRRVQAKLAQFGSVGPPQAPLSDGNHAGAGDLVRARLNTQIDAGGRQLTNRDILQVTAFRGPDAEVRRQRPDGTWTERFRVPRAYLARYAELAYAGNIHVAQGRTVDTAHLLVTDTLSRQALYVGMTRGRQSNTAHVVTGNTAPPGHQPYQQATPEAVLASVMQRDAGDLSATEQIRQAQDWAGGTGHLLTLWSAATRQALYPDIDQQIKARLTESEAWRYDREHSRKALQQRLRAAQLAGHDISDLIGQITAVPMDRARSISSVLHYRLQQITLPELAGHEVTWAQRTPAGACAVAHEFAAGLDQRAWALGDQMAVSPEPWLARHLGVLAPAASPGLREEYARRAATVAAYRETAGITDPQQAVSLLPHRSSPELEDMRLAAIRALEIRDEDDIIRGMTHGELEARILAAERAQASAPPDVSRQLRRTAQAEADAWQQSAEAATRHDQVQAANAKALAGRVTAERQRLEAANARYEQWSAASTSTRETGAKARAELERRGLVQQSAEPSQPQAAKAPEADISTVDTGVDGANHQPARLDELLTVLPPQPGASPPTAPGARPGPNMRPASSEKPRCSQSPHWRYRVGTTWRWSCKSAGAGVAGHDRSCLTCRDRASRRRRQSPGLRRPAASLGEFSMPTSPDLHAACTPVGARCV